MRTLSLSSVALASVTLALCAGTAGAQTTYRMARSEAPQPQQEAASAASATAARTDAAQTRRQHARHAQQMARAHLAPNRAEAAEAETRAAISDESLPLGDAVIVTEAPQPEGE
jgi:hypothetical protein